MRLSLTLPAAGTIASRTMSTVVEGGLWNLPIPADLLAAYGAANSGGSISYEVTNLAGNSASGSLAFQVDTAAPVLSLNPVTAEQWAAAAADGTANPITLGGTVQGLEAERPLTLTLNGTSLAVARSSANPEAWSLALPPSLLARLRSSGNSLTLVATDRAGNSATLSQEFEAAQVDTTPPTILLPADRTYTVAEGKLLIAMLKADRPVSWSLVAAEANLAINAATGGLAFQRPITLADADAAGNVLGDQRLELFVVATDQRNNQTIEPLTVVVTNTADPAADLFDQDGIAAAVEDVASNGRSTTPGDLNNDGIPDKFQPNVAAVPWISKENFEAATADPSKAAVNSFAALQSSPDVRIASVAVRKPEELAAAGNGSSALPSQLGTNTLQAPYDPLAFRLESYDSTSLQPLDQFIDLAPPLADGSDPYPGIQVRQQIDLPGDGLRVNTYLKWNPSANNGAGSWYEFLADGDPTTYDNGAELIDLNGDGLIERIVLTYTDGDPAGGDIDGLVNGIIDDPGLPVQLVDETAPTLVEAASSSDGTTITLTMNEALAAAGAPTSAYGIRVDGAAAVIRSATLTGDTSVVLSLERPIVAGQQLSLSYSDPTAADDANALQDLNGNDAGSINASAVINRSTVAAPTLRLSDDRLGLRVEGVSGTGLWLQVQALSADAAWQTSLELVSGDGVRLGAVGATPGSANLGSTEVFVAAGQELRFVQNSRNGLRNNTPNLRITAEATGGGNGGGSGFQLQLDDGGGKDQDFNDLQVRVSSRLTASDARANAMARLQTGSADALLDLTGIPASGARLTVSITADCANSNRLGFVKVDIDPITGVHSVAGIAAANSDAFRSALVNNLINPGGNPIQVSGQTTLPTLTWELTAAAAGIYAPVLIGPNGQVFSYGSTTAADGQQHVKLLGSNSFGFEDLLSSQHSDWDFNDVRVQVALS